MIPEWLKESAVLVFVLPLLFAVGFLIVSIIPATLSAYVVMWWLFNGAMVVIALDVFAVGIYGILWLIDEYRDWPTPS